MARPDSRAVETTRGEACRVRWRPLLAPGGASGGTGSTCRTPGGSPSAMAARAASACEKRKERLRCGGAHEREGARGKGSYGSESATSSNSSLSASISTMHPTSSCALPHFQSTSRRPTLGDSSTSGTTRHLPEPMPNTSANASSTSLSAPRETTLKSPHSGGRSSAPPTFVPSPVSQRQFRRQRVVLGYVLFRYRRVGPPLVFATAK